MKAKPAPTPPTTRWEAQPLDWLRASGQADQLMAALEVRKKRQRRRRAVAAAGGAATLLVIGLVWLLAAGRLSWPNRALTSSGRALVTVPERRTLPDGSVVEFKPGAEIAVDFSPEFRRVTLAKGEALFQVAKNPARPFIVSAGGVRFRAVGTAFTVELGSTSVEMLVTEGRVAVEKNPAPESAAGSSAPAAAPLATVEAGHRVVVELAPAAVPTAPAVLATSVTEASEKLAWRVPRLDFNETPLWEVVSLLNQHSGSRISLASPELGRVEISGALRADNIDPLLQTLEANYHIQVVRHDGGEIDLKPAR